MDAISGDTSVIEYGNERWARVVWVTKVMCLFVIFYFCCFSDDKYLKGEN